MLDWEEQFINIRELIGSEDVPLAIPEPEQAEVFDSAEAGDQTRAHALFLASQIAFLSSAALLPPKLPSHQEMEQVLLDLTKQSLVKEYFGDEQPM